MLKINNDFSNSGTFRKIDNNHIMLEMSEGNLTENEPCFVSDENKNEYVILPSIMLKNILENMKKAQEEKFAISLERDIANHMPIDFEDVLSVAKSKLDEDINLSNINTNALVKDIKKEYPNLFFNLDDYIKKP